MARAESSAAQLGWPSISVDLNRPPSVGLHDDASRAVVATIFPPVRVGAGLSLVDLYRSRLILDAARADCELHDAQRFLRELSRRGADGEKLDAWRAQLAFLDSRQPAWSRILDAAEARLAASSATVPEVDAIRTQVATLERARIGLEGQIKQVESLKAETVVPALGDVRAAILEASRRLEEKESSLRLLNAWDFQVSGGVLPDSLGGASYVGNVHLGYRLGHAGMVSREQRYLEARAQELEGAEYEVGRAVDELVVKRRLEAEQARRQAGVLENLNASLTTTRGLLAGSSAPGARQLLDQLELSWIVHESERLFLAHYADDLDPRPSEGVTP